MVRRARPADLVRANVLSPSRQKLKKVRKAFLADIVVVRRRMSQDVAIQESEIISIRKAVAEITRRKMNATLVGTAIARKVRAIRTNGNPVIGSQEMSKLTSGKDFVSFRLDDGTYENLHADRLGDNLFLLDNSPFYTYDVSYCDEVIAEQVDGRLLFRSVAKRGGHSTYRVKLPTGHNHETFLKKFTELEKLGCTYEGTGNEGRRLYTIDLPPHSDVAAVYKILEAGEEGGDWEFEEAHFFKGYA